MSHGDVSIPNQTTKLKAFADEKFNVAKMIISLCDREEESFGKHCGKRRKCCLPAFSPFPKMFSKAFFFSVVKIRDCVVKD